jgi:methylated-DNA-[protein]-cysteine S-methyltransferase
MKNKLPLTSIISSPIRKLGLCTANNKILRIEFLNPNADCFTANNAYDKHVIKELKKYFDNPKHVFDVAYDFVGTDFQNKIWKALVKIPLGSALTYGDLAKKLQTGPRAVGNACRRNYIPIIIPCHRIVAQNHLGGFAGKTAGSFTDIKKWLLNHENYKII